MKWLRRERTLWDEVLFDQAVPEDHFLRQVEGTVDLSFINDLCGHLYKDGGRPAEEPERIFRMYLLRISPSRHNWLGRSMRTPPIVGFAASPSAIRCQIIAPSMSFADAWAPNAL